MSSKRTSYSGASQNFPVYQDYRVYDPKVVRAYLGNPSKRFKIINDKFYTGTSGTETEGFEGRVN